VFQFRIFTAPFHFVNFADFWLADQLNSLSCVLLDIEFLICYYAVEVDWLGAGSKYSLVHSICSDIFGTNVSRLQQMYSSFNITVHPCTVLYRKLLTKSSCIVSA